MQTVECMHTWVYACQLIQVPYELCTIDRIWDTSMRRKAPVAVRIAKRFVIWAGKRPTVVLIQFRSRTFPGWVYNGDIDGILQTLQSPAERVGDQAKRNMQKRVKRGRCTWEANYPAITRNDCAPSGFVQQGICSPMDMHRRCTVGICQLHRHTTN